MASNPNATKLNAAVDDLRDVQKRLSAFEDSHDSQRKVNKYLRAKIDDLQDRLDAAADRIEFLEAILDVGDTRCEGDRDRSNEKAGRVSQEGERSMADIGVEGSGNRISAGTDREHADDVKEIDKIKISGQLGKSKEVKDAVNESYKLLLGVRKLDAKSLPTYPYQMDPSAFPKDASGNALIRVDWKQHADHAINAPALERVFAHVKQNGATLWPLAASALAEILDIDLKAKVVQRFQYMASSYKRKAKDDAEAERKAAEADEIAAADGIADESETLESRMSRSTKNSRAQAKLDQRGRKRPKSQYDDSKYDSAFTLTAMSADEDEADPEPGKPKRFVSRAPDYRSEEVQNLYNEIDALADPDPDKAKSMTLRIRGTAYQNAEPPKAKKLKNKIRIWQVRPALLDENPHWVSTARVVGNGVAWGDAEDPVDVELENAKEKMNQKVMRVSVDLTKKRKMRGGDEQPGKGKARMAEILDGEDEDALFEDA